MAREPAGRFCWLDLAARDAPPAIEFYGELFGWRAHSCHHPASSEAPTANRSPRWNVFG
jgi:predicted enzyme related to lactoylglutathione lyase